MRITVDTEKDSPQTLRRAAKLILEFADGPRVTDEHVPTLPDMPNPSLLFSDDNSSSDDSRDDDGDSMTIIPY